MIDSVSSSGAHVAAEARRTSAAPAVCVRATAASVLSLVQNLFGLAGGPLLTGLLSDRYGLPFALAVVPLSCLVAAALFALASRTYLGDLARVGQEEQRVEGNLEPQAA